MNRDEALELIRTNGWFSYKELQVNLNMNKHQIKYLFCDKLRIKLKEEFKKWLFKKFQKEIKPVNINKEFNNIPLSTIYRYYGIWRNSSAKRKSGINKRILINRLNIVGFSLSRYRREYLDSPDKVKNALRYHNLYEWFLEKRKEYKLTNNIEKQKYKRYELTNKAFNIFKTYPNAINMKSSKLATMLDCSSRSVRRLKKKYIELKEKKEKK